MVNRETIYIRFYSWYILTDSNYKETKNVLFVCFKYIFF